MKYLDENKFNKRKTLKDSGFTLIESIIGIAIFLIIASAIYSGFLTVSRAVEQSRDKIIATSIANERMEIVRNLTYSDIGIPGGIPDGKIVRDQIVTVNGRDFEITTTVRNIDDPFDGLFPDDTSPADYKLVEIEVDCLNCRNFNPIYFSTHIGTGGLETASDNGALFVRVFDASGDPVSGAEVYIENNKATTTIIINDTTDINGFLKIIDAPPGFDAYEITVSKEGYSSERTYPGDSSEIPNPTRPHATVALQTLTQMSFSIDKVSSLNIKTVTNTCDLIPNMDFDLFGSKVLGIGPDTLKYDEEKKTGIDGEVEVSDLEWDSYDIRFSDISFDIAGTIPALPLSLNPGTSQDLKIVLSPKNENSLLVVVRDTGSGLPLSDASVTLDGSGGFSETLHTGRGFLTQSDWTGGSGQEDFVDVSRFYSSSHIDFLENAGGIRLEKIFVDEYQFSGELISSTFDTGSDSDFHRIFWLPQGQPAETGTSSVKMQIATNNDNTTWNFLGHDGTDETFYTISEQNINVVHNGDRYLRYKLFLSTEDTSSTPIVSDVFFTFTSECVPPGQVLFSGLSLDDYDLSVSRSGYADYNETEIPISSSWSKKEVSLSP